MFRLLIAALAVSIALPAFAQGQNCGPRESVHERLKEGFGESIQSIGLLQNNGVMEIWANVDTGTWTVVVTAPDASISCLVASGQGFSRIDAEAHPTGMKL